MNVTLGGQIAMKFRLNIRAAFQSLRRRPFFYPRGPISGTLFRFASTIKDSRFGMTPVEIKKGNAMSFSSWIKKGLLGYQPIFFSNGLISGTGLQFFGNLRSMRGGASNDEAPVVDQKREENTSDKGAPFGVKVNSFNFNRGQLGNLYIPSALGSSVDLNTEFYYCIDENELWHFSRYNIVLLQMYQYFASRAIEIAKDAEIEIDSMIEIGANTCLFPLAFGELGVKECHGTDIVDYSEVVNLLSEMKRTEVAFHHMADDSDTTWRQLPKADLVWSYAVLLHQSNPLAHLTRLASLAKKAIFIMTLCDPEDWKSEDEMAIRYLSANSYYNADFPNCFDVTIVSPALIKYSLHRLGFSRVVEIPHPEFDLLDETSQRDLKYWLKKHCFFIAFRESEKDEGALDDYSVSAERSPYRGDNVLVHAGYHNNVVLSRSRYYIVPHGTPFVGDGTDGHLSSFASMTIAMTHFHDLEAERNPQPLLIRSLRKHNIIRYKDQYYLCPHGKNIIFSDTSELSRLHVLASLEKWDAMLPLLGGESGLASLDGIVVEFLDGVCITRTRNGMFVARHLEPNRLDAHMTGVGGSSSLADLVRKISVGKLMDSLTQLPDSGDLMYSDDFFKIRRLGSSEFCIQCATTDAVLSMHQSIEEAWTALFLKANPLPLG